MFARGDKYERQLAKCGIIAQPALRLATALTAFETSGEYDASIREWKAKPAADQTFDNFRPFIQREFTKKTKHDKTTAKSVGQGIANHTKIKDNRRRTFRRRSSGLGPRRSCQRHASCIREADGEVDRDVHKINGSNE